VRDHPLDRLPPDAFSPLPVLSLNVLGEPVVSRPAFWMDSTGSDAGAVPFYGMAGHYATTTAMTLSVGVASSATRFSCPLANG
jgi:hypothetical protein